MTFLFIAIPLMILTVSIAAVPLLVLTAREHRMRRVEVQEQRHPRAPLMRAGRPGSGEGRYVHWRRASALALT